MHLALIIIGTLVALMGGINSCPGATSDMVRVVMRGKQTLVMAGDQIVWTGPANANVTPLNGTVNGIRYSAALEGTKVLWENRPGAAAALNKRGTWESEKKQYLQEQRTILENQRKRIEAQKQELFGSSFSNRMNPPLLTAPIMQITNKTNPNTPNTQTNNLARLLQFLTSSDTNKPPTSTNGSFIHSSNALSGKITVTNNADHSLAPDNVENQILRVSTNNGSLFVTWDGKEINLGPEQGPLSTRCEMINGVRLGAVYSEEKVIWESLPTAGKILKISEKEKIPIFKSP